MGDFKIEKGTLRDILDFGQVGVGRAKSHLQKNFIKYFFIYMAQSISTLRIFGCSHMGPIWVPYRTCGNGTDWNDSNLINNVFVFMTRIVRLVCITV